MEKEKAQKPAKPEFVDTERLFARLEQFDPVPAPKEFEDYFDGFEDDKESLAEEVDKILEERREEFKGVVQAEIASYIVGGVPHYEWYPGPRDDVDKSGQIVREGMVDTNQKTLNFLFYEFTGEKIRSHDPEAPDYFWYYPNYGDRLTKKTADLGTTVICDVLNRYIEEAFPDGISEEDWDLLFAKSFDAVLENSEAVNFYSGEYACMFLGIGEEPLSFYIEEGAKPRKKR